MLFYRDVHVYRLISKDTVEAAMLAQADRKLELEKQIQRKCQQNPYRYSLTYSNPIDYLKLLHTLTQYHTHWSRGQTIGDEGGMGSIPYCSEFWLSNVLVVKGVSLEEVT